MIRLSKTTAVLALCFLGFGINAQVGVSSSGSDPDSSAMLDVQSNARGVLLPRMTEDQRNAISGPATSLLLYQSDQDKGFYFNQGSSLAPDWTKLNGDCSSSGILIDTLPYTIAASGYYYLSESLTGSSGITINSSNVTLNLNGNAIIAGGGATGDGIISGTGTSQIKVYNGYVVDWPLKGINLELTDVSYIQGINVNNSGSDGISCNTNCTVTSCQVLDAGADGIEIGNYSIVNACQVQNSGDNGIETEDYCQISFIQSFSNTGKGITSGLSCRIDQANCALNTEQGIKTGASNLVNGSVSAANGFSGIDLGMGSRCQSSTSYNNAQHGYLIDGDCYLIKNNANGNTLSGFYTTSSSVTLTQNQSTGNTQNGFYVNSIGKCTIVKNTSADNGTNQYDINSGNVFGPIITDTDILTATNPFSNISF